MRKIAQITAVMAVAYLVSGVSAMADASTTIGFGSLWDVIRPYLAETFAAFVAVLMAYLSNMASKYFKVSIDAQQSQRLQNAMLNAAGLLIQRYGPDIANIKLDVKNPVLAMAAQKVMDSIPDVLTHFGIETPTQVAERIQAKLGQLVIPPTSAVVSDTPKVG